MSETVKVFGTTYTGVTALKVSDGNSNTLTYTLDGGGGGGDATLITKSITANGTYDAEDDSADGYSSVTVTVPTGTARTSADLTASGDTVTVPAGLYAKAATKSVAAGTAGTPTATKGTVSNHQVSITPSVTNTTGYITGGTKTGTAVTVSASELVSGSQNITANANNIDVANLATVNVAVPFSTIYVETTDPTSSNGSNGDIWIKTEGS